MSSDPNDGSGRTPPRNHLTKFSLLGSAAELERRAIEQTPLLGSVCLSGEATVWYGQHGSAKTLISLSLLIDAIQTCRIKATDVFYVDVDDSSAGLAQKVRILEEFGVHVLAQGHQGFKSKSLIPTLELMIEEDAVRGVFLILDTMKKFVNLMDKREASSFSEVMRRFVMKGGSLLCLAHTNKRPGPDGKPIYGGTSDIVDDFDASYIIAGMEGEMGASERIIEFVSNKNRGVSAPRAYYAYDTGRELDYVHRLASVHEVDSKEMADDRRFDTTPTEGDIIDTIRLSIEHGRVTKMKVIHQVAKFEKVSQRTALFVLEKYTGDDPEKHHWNYTVMAHGAKVYSLLNKPGADGSEGPASPE